MMKTWNWPQFTLALLAFCGLVAVTVIEQWYGKAADEGTKQILIGFATLAFAFFFQSSVGSKLKDDTIAALAAAPLASAVTGRPAKVEVVNDPAAPVKVQEVAALTPHSDASSHQ